MAVFAVYIEKEEEYFGGVRVFGNTYHYSTLPTATFNDAAIASAVAEAERQITQSAVTFTAWRTWGPTDGPVIDNIIRDDGALSGPGLAVDSASMYREACVLVRWPLERSAVLNRKRWLRKFIRLPGSQAQGWSSDVIGGYAALQQAFRDEIRAEYADPVTEIGIDGPALSTALGDLPTGPAEVMPYMYTRQIGQ